MDGNGETTHFECKNLVHHPTQTTIKNWVAKRVPRGFLLVTYILLQDGKAAHCSSRGPFLDQPKIIATHGDMDGRKLFFLLDFQGHYHL